MKRAFFTIAILLWVVAPAPSQGASETKWVDPYIYSLAAPAETVAPDPAKEAIKDERDARNLAAQETVAQTSSWGFYLNCGQFLLSAAGIIFVVRSLNLNRAATDAAVIAANAAREAIALERAYMIFTPPFYVSHRHVVRANGIGLSGRGGAINVIIRNQGRSPAIRFGMDARILVLPIEQGAEFEERPVPFRGGIVGIGADVYSENLMVTEGDMDRVLERRAAIYVFGHVQYQDIFDSRVIRGTVAAYRITLDHMDMDENGRPAPRFLCVPFGAQNRIYDLRSIE
ncbi:hypothetical protein GOZ83_05035 [Agrobacterium vitis]|uniref:hypothetical protein n=1 Tax=Rhizobium/Agrobacterium group TaxID=227290 RepID=UPI0012E6F8E9|nr:MULTISPECIES: hypothetical protein [Rhizobium/Agrobacterium group]MCF1492455.1 hypothetical protein [Allorhizobium ampelinum]MVA44445.1 hypothetical protein [Agrobacterium vitis]